jgi:hypothetical protein
MKQEEYKKNEEKQIVTKDNKNIRNYITVKECTERKNKQIRKIIPSRNTNNNFCSYTFFGNKLKGEQNKNNKYCNISYNSLYNFYLFILDFLQNLLGLSVLFKRTGEYMETNKLILTK